MTGLTSYIYNFISSKVDRTKNSKSTNKQQDFEQADNSNIVSSRNQLRSGQAIDSDTLDALPQQSTSLITKILDQTS